MHVSYSLFSASLYTIFPSFINHIISLINMCRFIKLLNLLVHTCSYFIVCVFQKTGFTGTNLGCDPKSSMCWTEKNYPLKHPALTPTFTTVHEKYKSFILEQSHTVEYVLLVAAKSAY